MNRFEALEIRDRQLVTAIFRYEDYYIDSGLRTYAFDQALHLYLKRQGYSTIVFFDTSGGYTSYERDMLENFLSQASPETQNAQPTVIPEEINGRLRNSPLLRRKRSATANPDQPQGGPVDVARPHVNLYQDSFGKWHMRGTGERVLNAQYMNRMLTSGRHLALVVLADDTAPEFNNEATQIVAALKTLADHDALNSADINDNRLIVVVNAQACRQQIMKLFSRESHHRSVFMSTYFESLFTHTPPRANAPIINPKYTFVMPAPTTDDVRHEFMRDRLETGRHKEVDWDQIDSICEQFALKDDTTLRDLHKAFSKMKDYKMASFKQFGIERRGDTLDELNNGLIGLRSVKDEIASLQNFINLKRSQGADISSMSLHMVFYGNPGTGKTTVARLIGRIFKDMGILERGHVVEVGREYLVAGYVGQTAIKTTNVINSAIGGVLFIDEAYRLAEGGENDFGTEAINTLLARMENDRHRLVVILAGYKADMEKLYQMNDGIPSRINRYIEFEDYSDQELREIFRMRAAKEGYTIAPEANDLLLRVMDYARNYKGRSNDANYKFGNARFVRNLFELIEIKIANRSLTSDTGTILPADFVGINMKEMQGFTLDTGTAEQERPSAFDRLEALVGLADVKAKVKEMVDYMIVEQQQRALGLAGPAAESGSLHMVFYGNPGTGKTIVARLMGEILRECGRLSSGHVVEAAREDLVANHLGGTAQLVTKVVESALDGVLFIDEAYNLIKDERDSFGHEAVDSLLKHMEDHRERLVVIIAGYTNRIKQLIASNPGLQSRFTNYITFRDYSADELKQILRIDLKNFKLTAMVPDAQTAVDAYIERCFSHMTSSSGNGRWTRNLAQNISAAHTSAIADDFRRGIDTSAEKLTTCTLHDVEEGIRRFERNSIR